MRPTGKKFAATAAGLGLLGAAAMAMQVGTQAGPDARAGTPPQTRVVVTDSPTAAAAYKVDPVHSVVLFRVKHAGTAHYWGRFNSLDGGFTFDPENPQSGSFEFTIDNASVDTANEQRDNHLRSPDFFNARQYPTTTFKSTSVEAAGENRFKVTGDLDLHGVTRQVTADLEWLGTGSFRGNPIGAFEATLEIKRTDFGMDTFVAEDGSDSGGLGNTVRLTVAVEARRQG